MEEEMEEKREEEREKERDVMSDRHKEERRIDVAENSDTQKTCDRLPWNYLTSLSPVERIGRLVVQPVVRWGRWKGRGGRRGDESSSAPLHDWMAELLVDSLGTGTALAVLEALPSEEAHTEEVGEGGEGERFTDFLSLDFYAAIAVRLESKSNG